MLVYVFRGVTSGTKTFERLIDGFTNDPYQRESIK